MNTMMNTGMNMRSPELPLSSFRTLVRLVASAAFVTAFVTGCPPPEPGGDDGPAPAPECVSSSDCRDADSGLGELCVDDACAPCASAADCSADDVYGADATCIEGRCTVCSPGEVGCACLDDSYCLQGEGCRDGLCRPCDPGDALCPCAADDDCSGALVCQGERCVADDCVAGEEGCACADAGDADCADDLVCGDGVCRACPADVEGCPCDGDGDCGNDLVCDAGLTTCRAATSCTELTCGEARLCGESSGRASCLEECADGFQFDAASDSCVPIAGANCDAGAPGSILASCQTQNRTCVETGDTAACAACLSSGADCFVGPADPAQGACRLPTTCATCDADHRTCDPATGCGDVTCDGCVDGFFERQGACVIIENVDCSVCDGVNRDCLQNDNGNFCGGCSVHWSEDPDGTCVPVDNCVVAADNSLVDRCAALNRPCVEASGGAPAECGDCPAESVVDPNTQICVSLAACDSRDDCPEDAGFFCTQLGLQDQPQCRPAQCASDETFNRFSGACDVCPLTCADDPATGTSGVWPVSDRNGNCLCATSPGFFWDAAAATGEAVACDRDNDGWLNEKIFQVFKTSKRSQGALRDDFAVSLSVNCPIPEVDEFVLHNEWNQELVLDVISLGASGAITLFETARNDRDDEDLLPVDAAAVNTLTKVCGSTLDDYNDNGSSDFQESQLTTTGREWQVIFNQLGFFMELYSGSYDPATRRYTISERPRDDADFPFHYFPGDDADADHWRCCTRRRDQNFNPDEVTAYDFAGYECDEFEGECSYTWPDQWGRTGSFPTPPPAVLDVPGSVIPSYDACSDDRVAPLDDVWRGMTHYSQFRCAKVVNVADNGAIAASEVRLADIYVGALDALDVNYVDNPAPFQLQTCTTDATGQTSCLPEGGGAAVSAAANNVTWLVRRPNQDYNPAGIGDAGYDGGCIDEFKELPELCPSFVANPAAVQGDGEDTDFGRLSCGCGVAYGGLGCDVGCPSVEAVHAETGYLANLVEREGFWSCVEPAVSGFSDGTTAFVGDVPNDGGGTDTFSITGAVPLATGVGDALAEASPPACATPPCGFTIR